MSASARIAPRLPTETRVNVCQNINIGASSILGIALLTIGLLGACGVLPGMVVGVGAVCLSIGLVVSSCIQNMRGESIRRRKGCILIQVIVAVVMATLGALTIAGLISPTVMGWCIILPTLLVLAIALCTTVCIGGCLAVIAPVIIGQSR